MIKHIMYTAMIIGSLMTLIAINSRYERELIDKEFICLDGIKIYRMDTHKNEVEECE